MNKALGLVLLPAAAAAAAASSNLRAAAAAAKVGADPVDLLVCTESL